MKADMPSQQHTVFGWHAVVALLHADPLRIKVLWVDQQRRDKRSEALIQAAEQAGVSIHWVTRKTLDKLCPEVNHQGVVAQCKASASGQSLGLSEQEFIATLDVTQAPLLLVLDGVTDPHNLGACLRCADGAGVSGVIIPRHRAVGLTPVVRKVACGAAETMPLLQVTNLVRTLKTLQDMGFWVVGTSGEATTSLYETRLDGPMVLVMGAEGKGARRLTQQACDTLLHIPMHGHVPSLNVSVATGICLYEALRQRTRT